MRTAWIGVGCAVLTALLISAWFQIQSWLIRGSGYTDLPGQDTLQLVLNLAPYAFSIIALLGGRVSGLLCRSTRWLAALVGVSPLLLLTAVSPPHSWHGYILFPFLAIVGAYAPIWMARRATTKTAVEAVRRA
jgi:hypothetical protein